MAASAHSAPKILLCQAGSISCGLRLESVSETMRPLPIEPIHGMPEFVSGLSVVRGAPVPVVDLAVLLGARGQAQKGRFVVVGLDARRVALSVADVIGIRTLDAHSLAALPSLLGDARTDFVSAISSLDAQLLLVLESARIVPESVWSVLELAGGGE